MITKKVKKKILFQKSKEKRSASFNIWKWIIKIKIITKIKESCLFRIDTLGGRIGKEIKR